MPNIIKSRTKEKKETFAYPQKEGDKDWPKTKKQAKEMIEEHNKQYIHDNYHANARRGKVSKSEIDLKKLDNILKRDKEYQVLIKERTDNEEAMKKAEEGKNYQLAGQLWENRWKIQGKITKRYKELREKTLKNK